MNDEAQQVTAYCVAAADELVVGHGWRGGSDGGALMLQSVWVTGGGFEVTTVYTDVEEFREDASRPCSQRRIVETSPEGWLVLVAGSGERPALERRVVPVGRSGSAVLLVLRRAAARW